MILDEVFGKDAFRNEIIWSYDFGGRSKEYWPTKHDTVFFYTKSKTWTFNIDDIDRLEYK